MKKIDIIMALSTFGDQDSLILYVNRQRTLIIQRALPDGPSINLGPITVEIKEKSVNDLDDKVSQINTYLNLLDTTLPLFFSEANTLATIKANLMRKYMSVNAIGTDILETLDSQDKVTAENA